MTKQLIRFAVVGGSAFIIDYFFMVFLTEILCVPYLLSNIFSFCISVIYNYILSTIWVFTPSGNKKKSNTFYFFIILSVIGLIINESILWVLVDLFHVSYKIGKIVAAGLVMIYNFITRKLLLERGIKRK